MTRVEDILAQPYAVRVVWSDDEPGYFVELPELPGCMSQGATFQAGGGVSGPSYTYGQKPFVKLKSAKCRPNRIYGIDPATFQRYFPNDLTMKWVMDQGGMAGLGNVFRPVYNGRRLTDLSAAEFEIWWQLAQVRPNANMIYKGLHSKRTYDATS